MLRPFIFALGQLVLGDDTIARADAKLYEAKTQGRDRVLMVA